MNIYERIKYLRTSLGMSQEELAKKVGYEGRSAISKVENGERDISQSMIVRYAQALNVSPTYLMFGNDSEKSHPKSHPVKIPVYGMVAAGMPKKALTDIEDYEEIPESLACTGEFAALRINGNSMLPRFAIGDVVIVRLQDDVDSGDVAIVMVGDGEATCKKIKKTNDGVLLISTNPEYEPIFYTNKQICEEPVRIWGKVVELRAKF